MANSNSPGNVSFPTTHWTSVYGVAGNDASSDALGRLLTRYLPALRAHLISIRLKPDLAEDLLQDFILDKVIKGRLISHADHYRGKFRTFLLNVLGNYIISWYRRQASMGRHPKRLTVDLDEGLVSSDGPGPTLAYDLEWARELLDETLRRMEQHLKESGRPEVWGVFTGRLLDPTLHEAEPIAYDVLIQRFGFQSPSQAANAVITGKRMFHRILRSTIGEYARDESEIDEEIRDFRQALEQAGAMNTQMLRKW